MIITDKLNEFDKIFLTDEQNEKMKGLLLELLHVQENCETDLVGLKLCTCSEESYLDYLACLINGSEQRERLVGFLRMMEKME